ncbi:MAG: hypothetical protein ACXAC7_15945 [Candidatus Hodarchaeales archaeon]|jgi:hypothetical protein
MSSYPELTKLKNAINQNISILGQISQAPWQHLILFPKDHPFCHYFDLEDGYQIVIYSMNEINVDGLIRIFGKVITVKGGSKRLNTKSNDSYTEYHILVEKWEMINSS